MIKVIDTYGEIEKLLESESFDMGSWKKYCGKISRKLRRMAIKGSKNYDFEKQVLPVMEYLFSHKELADTAHASFVRATDKLNAKCDDKLNGRVDSDIVLYMGLCNGAGWAARLKGKPVVLLGIEKIVELGWNDEENMAGLIYHELGHNWHFQNRKVKTSLKTDREKSLWQLYTEGMAMYFEHKMSDEAYFQSRNKDGWLDWCNENRHRIAEEYLKRVNSGESVQDFFGDWRSFEGHSDVGYYLGAEVVGLISEKCDIDTLLNISLDDFEGYLKRI